MELFIDSADPEIIAKYGASGIFKGVTTNPTFMSNRGFNDDITMVRRIRQLFEGEIHVEAIGKNAGEIVDNAHRIIEATMPIDATLCVGGYSHDKNIVFKIPFTDEGVKACKKLTSERLTVSLHLVQSVNQALIAAHAGATYICVLVGRMEDEVGIDGLFVASQIVTALRKDRQINTKVMVSSVRHSIHVSKAWLFGADAITIPPRVIDLMYNHPTTEKGLQRFWDDYFGSMPLSVVRVNRKVIVRPDKTLRDALAKMVEEKTSAVIIASSDKELNGIFTMGDFKRCALREEVSLDHPLEDFIKGRVPKMINLSESVAKAREMMIKNEIEQLVVVDDGIEIVGLLQMKDIIVGDI